MFHLKYKVKLLLCPEIFIQLSLFTDPCFQVFRGHWNTLCRYHSIGTFNSREVHPVALVKRKNRVAVAQRGCWRHSSAAVVGLRRDGRVLIVEYWVVFSGVFWGLSGLPTVEPDLQVR